MHQHRVASCTCTVAVLSCHALGSLCRELKQHSLAEWRAAREHEEREITAQLVEQKQLQKQVRIAAAFALVIGPAVVLKDLKFAH